MFTTYVVQPIYNLFVFLIGAVPGGDVGLAIIVLTVAMRLALYPLFTASIRTQMGMQAMQAELDVVKERVKDKQELAKKQLELARKHKVNPLAMLGSLVIQFGLIIALYFAMFHEGFPEIDEGLLYSFVQAPAVVNTNFLGILDLLTPHHLVLAALIGLTQYAAIELTLKRTPPPSANASAEKLAAHKMQQQMMRYFLPGLLGVFGWVFPAGVGLYFLTGNVVSIGQEWVIRRQLNGKNASGA